MSDLEGSTLSAAEKANPSLPGPTVPTLTNKDTSLVPSSYVLNVLAYSSPWIDLCSTDPVIASVSRQALNLEVAYANFCGVRSVIIPGPRQDGDGRAIAQYVRAVQETFEVATRVNIIIHMPMYREPGLEEKVKLLSEDLHPDQDVAKTGSKGREEVDLFGAWDTWHSIRSVCQYSTRLFVGKAAFVHYISLPVSRSLANAPAHSSTEDSATSPGEGAPDSVVCRTSTLLDPWTKHLPAQQNREPVPHPIPSGNDLQLHALEKRALVPPLRRRAFTSRARHSC